VIDAPRTETARIVCLTTTLLTDRMFRYSGLLGGMAASVEPVVWSTARNPAAHFESFPAVDPWRNRLCMARRVVDYAYDRRGLSERRDSFWRLRRRHELPRAQRLLHTAGGCVARLRLEGVLERWLEPRLIRQVRSEEADRRLRELRPAALLTTSPFRLDEPGVVAAAKRQKIPVIAFITSFDNVSTKARFILRHDAYVVWSRSMRDELHRFYPASRDVPVYVVGAPQFDLLRRPGFRQTREAFCAEEGLRADRPIILYGLGSPNLIREHHGALELAGRLQSGALGDAQLLVRPHPVFGADPGLEPLRALAPRVRVQDTACEDPFQDERQIRKWVNALAHADVVVNLSSTLSVDACVLDRPVVNLDYDPEPGAPHQQLVREINSRWNHFRPVVRTGGLWLVADADAMVDAIAAYLENPQLHRAGRARAVKLVCGAADGRAGERMGEAVARFVREHAS